MVPPDAIAETAPKRAYEEVEGDDAARIYLRCHCGQVIKKRRDSYVPGLHVVICLACNNCSTEAHLLSGEHVEQKAADAA
jgi:hypothetical protein